MTDLLKKDGTPIASSLPLHIATYIESAKKIIISIDEMKLTQRDRDLLFEHLISEKKNGLSAKQLVISSGYTDFDYGTNISYTVSGSKDISEPQSNYILLELNVDHIND